MPNDAILLCGGAGLRLRSVIGNAPKGMADVAGRPFLELLLRQLRRFGFERALLAVGYQHDRIQSHFGDAAFGLELIYSAESHPLGTGGALRNAAALVATENVLIMNGDSYTDVDLAGLMARHRDTGAAFTMAVVPADGRGDCGSVLMDEDGSLASFEEKQGAFQAPYVNAGIYVASRQMLYDIPADIEVSLEKELLPRWLREGRRVRGFLVTGKCVDIGTPERYRSAQDMLADAEAAAALSQREGRL